MAVLASYLQRRYLVLFVLQLAISSCYSVEDVDFLDEKWSNYHLLIHEALDNYTECKMDADECSTCHYGQIAADLAPWKEGITHEMLGIASTRAVTYQIINHKLYRSNKCVFEARCQGVEHFIKSLLPDLPDMEFKMNHFDHPASPADYLKLSPIFSFSKDSTYVDIMYPAWTFHSGGPAVWPIYPTGQGDWEGTRDWLIDVAETGYPWEKKENRGYFIGSRTSAERDPLILLSRSNPELVEAAYTKNQAYKGPQDTLNAEPVKPKKYDEHCAFKYLFNFRGVAASFRFKHLFLCDSLVFHVGDEWLEFFYPAMKPWVHYIPVPIDLSNVEELLEFARENDVIAKQIADRGSKFIRDHLRQKDIFCYWKKVLIEYSKLLKFKTKLDSSLKYIAG